MGKIKFKFVFSVILLSAHPASADLLVLDDFLNNAMTRNYEIREARLALKEAEGRKAEVWGSFFPQISAGYSKNYIDRNQEITMQMPLVTPGGDTVYEEVSIQMGQKENQAANITVNLPVYTFGTVRGAYDITKESLKIEQKIYSSRRNRVICDVKKAFSRVLLAQEIVSVSRRQVSLMDENFNMPRKPV